MTAASAIAQSADATARLNARLEGASPAAVIAAAAELVGRDRLAVVSSFGTESAVLLKFVADVDRDIPVIFLDTGWLFQETLDYRDALVARLRLGDVRTVHPREEDLARHDTDRDLWFSNPDECCRIRKVEPLSRALQPFAAWINGRKRFHGGLRAAIPIVEVDGARLKFNPLATVSAEDLRLTFEAVGLPPHPLAASGFASVGCMPCTSRSEPDEDARAGRWRGRDKTECGIHTTTTA